MTTTKGDKDPFSIEKGSLSPFVTRFVVAMLVESGTRQHGAKEASSSLQEVGQLPIQLVNDFADITLREIQKKKQQGYSVIKTPHVGNQHPSNLVCAALGIHLHMVSFTSGQRDVNFHPHLRIEDGDARQLSCPTLWTPFAQTGCGSSLEAYHQQAVEERFLDLRVTTDSGMLAEHGELSTEILRVVTATISRLWYRHVDDSGVVRNVKDCTLPSHEKILEDVFAFTNQKSGWIVPNRAYILFDCIMQSLESGRDTIYHLAGPQMVGYIAGQLKSVSKAYDVFRQELPIFGLPEVLTLYVVPVASSRFVTHKSRRADLEEVIDVIRWYENLENQVKRFASERFNETAQMFREFFVSIESASFMSQYDIQSADDLCLSDWMLDTPLNRVQKMYQLFSIHLPKAS